MNAIRMIACIGLSLASLLPLNAQESLEFSLPSVSGKPISVSNSYYDSYLVVCFLGNECPIARHYAKRLVVVGQQFKEQGVKVIGINSNSQDSMVELKKFSSELDLDFDVLKDVDNEVADRFNAKRTPEVFVLDKDSKIQYHGRIDNQYAPGVNRSVATENYLVQALSELLNGNAVSVPNTEPVGCVIGRKKVPAENPTVTYTNQISRLIQQHCLECHRSGEIGPFALESYDEVNGWAEMMVEVVNEGRMPPWHATNDHRELVNARLMTDLEKKLLEQWLEQGTPFGETAELPSPRKFTEGWRLPKRPDKVIAMRPTPYTVPASGTVEYQYFVVDPGFKHDMWISAAEVIPGNRSVVHHSIVFIRPPDGVAFRGIGWLAAYVPGQASRIFQDTHARLIPAGSKLVFQQHYTPNGVAQQDVTQIGLVYADPSKITHEVFTLAALNQELEISPGDSDAQVASKLRWFPSNGRLLSVAPHMHYRGKAFGLFSIESGARHPLVEVPNYDFNWQHNYQFRQPLALENVDALEVEFKFDNSLDNPFNPAPHETVMWGDQTWQEMAVAFFEIAQPINDSITHRTKPNISVNNIADSKSATIVDRLFKKHDTNGDRFLIRDEMPRAISRFKFSEYDLDSDGKLSESELLTAIQLRMDKGK